MHLLHRRNQRRSHNVLEVYILPIEGIAFLELVKDADFDLTCVAIFRNGADDLDRHLGVRLSIDRFDDFPESPLAQ